MESIIANHNHIWGEKVIIAQLPHNQTSQALLGVWTKLQETWTCIFMEMTIIGIMVDAARLVIDIIHFKSSLTLIYQILYKNES